MVQPHATLGPVVIVSVKPKDFELKDFTKATAVNGREGHVHISSEPIWVFGGVKPGKHTLHVHVRCEALSARSFCRLAGDPAGRHLSNLPRDRD